MREDLCMFRKRRKGFIMFCVLFLLIASVPVLQNDSFAASKIDKNIYQSNGVEIKFKVNNQWENGFEGQFIITNNNKTPLENWRIKLKFTHEITSIWDGEIESHKANEYVIKHPKWNPNIAAGSSATVGFNGKCNNKVNLPTECTLIMGSKESAKEDYTITYRVTSDWGDAFNSEISITNNTKKAIEG